MESGTEVQSEMTLFDYKLESLHEATSLYIQNERI